MADLKDKIAQIKDEYAAEIVDQKGREFEEKAQSDALFMLGRIKQNDHIAIAVSTNLTAQSIRALEHFQEAGMYKTLGYTTFVDFLEKSQYSPMTKRQYYERRELMNNHGDEIYDLLTSVGISVRSQRMLGKGDLSIHDDKLMVGDQEIELADTGLIKDVLKEFVDEIRDLTVSSQKKADKIASLERQIEVGQDELSELERNLDALSRSNPQERALGEAVTSILEVSRVVGQMPDEKVKAKFGTNALPVLWSAIQQVKKSCGSNYSFEDAPLTAGSDLDDIAAMVLDGDEMD